MGIFNKLFGSDEPQDKVTNSNAMQWNLLTELKQLEEITEESYTKPVVIFKHSTRCSISRMALKNFEREFGEENLAEKISPHFLDLLNYRDISNEIAQKFHVIHQSPQIILLKEGKAVFDTSHSEIDAAELNQKI